VTGKGEEVWEEREKEGWQGREGEGGQERISPSVISTCI